MPQDRPKTRYDVSIVLPDESVESRRAMLRHLLENAFGLNVRRQVRDTDVFVLRKAGDAAFQPFEKGRTMASVVGLAEGRLARTVIDETGLKGSYMFVLPYPKTKAELYESLKGLGLTLTAERRPLDVVVVERAQK